MTNEKSIENAGNDAHEPPSPSPIEASVSDVSLAVEPEVEQDAYAAGSSSSVTTDRRQSSCSTVDMSSLDYQKPTESLSDDEIEENYLGNIPANRRRHGVVTSPIPTVDDIEVIRYTPQEPEEYNSYGLKRAQIERSGSFDKEDCFERDRIERGSKVSIDSDGELDSRASESSVSFSNTVAAHVRKDSIAISLEKMNGMPSRRKSPVRLGEITLLKKAQMHMTKRELLKQYRIHVFVSVVFIVTVAFVSAAWYFHDEAAAALATNQKIFFDPRSRILTLTDHVTSDELTGLLAQDIPRWQLPLHCPISVKGDPNAKECLWKKNAILRIFYFKEADIQCYNISWEYFNPDLVPFDCFDLGNAVWFGSSNLSADYVPIKGSFTFNPNLYQQKNNGVFSSVVEYYWLSSQAQAIVVNIEDPLHVSWNDTRPGKVCLTANFTSPFYSHVRSGVPHLNYTVCNGVDMVKTHTYMRHFFPSTGNLNLPDRDVLQLPLWSTKAEAKNDDVSETNVISLATQIKQNGLNCSTIELDGRWQRMTGDLDLDSTRFTNISAMLDSVKSAKCSLSMEISPFFHFSTRNFDEGISQNLFVKDSGGSVPGLTSLDEGVGAVLDVSNPSARSWFTGKISSLSAKYDVSAFRFTLGDKDWLPYKPNFFGRNLSPNKLRKMFTELADSISQKTIIETTSQSQHVGELLGIQSSIRFPGGRACLSGVISRALTAGLLGYPFVMSDGFQIEAESQSVSGGMPSRDIYIRWMQMSAFFPAVKYSLTPWSYDDVCLQVAKNMSRLHQSLILPIIENEMKEDIQNGLPILRPVWWADPQNKTAFDVSDQFLVGENLLVAPVLCEGKTNRNIFFPKGIWADKIKGGVQVGPKLVENYSVGQFQIPYFTLMKVYE